MEVMHKNVVSHQEFMCTKKYDFSVIFYFFMLTKEMILVRKLLVSMQVCIGARIFTKFGKWKALHKVTSKISCDSK